MSHHHYVEFLGARELDAVDLYQGWSSRQPASLHITRALSYGQFGGRQLEPPDECSDDANRVSAGYVVF